MKYIYGAAATDDWMSEPNPYDNNHNLVHVYIILSEAARFQSYL